MNSFTGPKRIWSYWEQGWSAAPTIPRMCLQSWQQRNPDWEVIPVDAINLDRHVRLNSKPFWRNVAASPMSDLIRINLLKQHGGVWTDATVWCHKPLSSWLSDDFFCFSSPTPDRPVATWFIAANLSSYLVSKWAEKANQYWTKPRRNKPYFWFNHLFTELYNSDALFQSLWDDKIKIDCAIRKHEGPHYFCSYTAQRMQAIAEGFAEFLVTTEIPMFKLSLHHELEQYPVLHQLFSSLSHT